MSLTPALQLRHRLHGEPGLAGRETRTAELIREFFAPLGADETLAGLRGAGLAFVFQGTKPGPALMLRCELDALPIDETLDFPYGSSRPGVSHKCGHDGHMAILDAVGLEPARFGLGAGEECADLHDPAYDFPDRLLKTGNAVFVRSIRRLLGP